MKSSDCLSPKYIKCKDGVFRSVPCGKCAACLVRKGMEKCNRIKDYIAGYNYQFFVTLTFDDDHLPLARFSEKDMCFYHDFDCNYEGEIYKFDLNYLDSADSDLLLETVQKFGGIPVLSHRILINFKKRLRYYLNKIKLDSYDFFIYACGEYGPSTYRPHYHFIFGSKSFISTDLFEKCVRSAWSFRSETESGSVYTSIGFIDVKRSFGQSSINYIAKYICCTTHLPSYLANACWKPFTSGSTRVSEYLQRLQQSSLREVFYNPTNVISVLRNGKISDEQVPSAYYSRYFPRVNRFDFFSDFELYRLYRLFEFYPCAGSAYIDFENSLFRLVDVDMYNGFNRVFDGKDKICAPLSVLQQCVYKCAFVNSDGSEIFDEFIRKRNFMRLWYVSRRVCLNAKELDISVKTYVDKIIDYYKQISLDRLKKFYEFQNELMEDAIYPVGLDYIFTLYYHTDNSIDYDYYAKQFGWKGVRIEDHPLQRKHIELSKGILVDTTKTKKRNDLFISRGLAPRRYVPRIPTNVSKFIKL